MMGARIMYSVWYPNSDGLYTVCECEKEGKEEGRERTVIVFGTNNGG